MIPRRLMGVTTVGALALLLARPLAASADEDNGRPVLDQAVTNRESAEEADTAAREADANKVKAAADAEQAHTAIEEGKEAAEEQADGKSTVANSAPNEAGGSALVDRLSERLGVSPAQAAGGAGAIFSVARQKLGADKFGKLAAAVPGTDSLLARAPSGGLGAAGGGTDSALGSMAGSSEQFGGVASLAGPFSQLGMSPDMAGKFLPIVLQYAQSTGGDSAMSLLASAFK